MTKFFLFCLIVGCAWWWFRRRAAGHAGRRNEAPPAASQNMVQCARCGVYLPEAEAVRVDGRPYCCIAHAPAGEVGGQ